VRSGMERMVKMNRHGFEAGIVTDKVLLELENDPVLWDNFRNSKRFEYLYRKRNRLEYLIQREAKKSCMREQYHETVAREARINYRTKALKWTEKEMNEWRT